MDWRSCFAQYNRAARLTAFFEFFLLITFTASSTNPILLPLPLRDLQTVSTAAIASAADRSSEALLQRLMRV